MKNVMEMTLAELCKVVAERWPFDGKNYEESARAQAQVSSHEYEALQLEFAIKHIHLELSEATGELGRFLRKLDQQLLTRKVSYLLKSADGRMLLAMHAKTLLLNLARLIEVAGLQSRVEEEMFFWASKHQPDSLRE